MKLIDRISLQRLLSMVFGFIISVLKILVPKNGVDNNGTNPIKKRLFQRLKNDTKK